MTTGEQFTELVFIGYGLLLLFLIITGFMYYQYEKYKHNRRFKLHEDFRKYKICNDAKKTIEELGAPRIKRGIIELRIRKHGNSIVGISAESDESYGEFYSIEDLEPLPYERPLKGLYDIQY